MDGQLQKTQALVFKCLLFPKIVLMRIGALSEQDKLSQLCLGPRPSSGRWSGLSDFLPLELAGH